MSKRAFFLSFLALAAVALAVGVRSLRRGPATQEAAGGAHEVTASAPSAAQTQAGKLYHCPMHPTMVSADPGNCPICQMRMVPVDEARAGGPPEKAPSFFAPGKKVIYRSTMNPNEISDHPGKDSMGMEMVPVVVEEAGAPAVPGQATVNIPLRRQQLIGVRTDVVRRAPLIRTIRTVGRVAVDETRLHHVHTKISGWVEKLYVNTTGEKIRRGEPLLTIYSPELLATQEEYMVALRSRRRSAGETLPEVQRLGDELVESARRRLQLFDLTPVQIEQLERTGEASRTVTLFAPSSGVVLERKVTHGEKIDPSVTLLDIADLSRVWVLASIYEYELPFVRVGQPATMTLSYLPGKAYRGRVGFIYPVLEGSTRTAQVRVELDNPYLDLRPEMYADVELQGNIGERLSVPDTAVMSTGTRDIVFVARGDGYFDPREVRVGARLPDRVEILQGLSEGESVVVSANFLIDSESKLKAALEAATGPGPAPSGASGLSPQTQPEFVPQTQPGPFHGPAPERER